MSIRDLREQERHEDIRRFLLVCIEKLGVPLYLLFWLADLAYMPERKWEFLTYRFAVVVSCLFLAPLIRRSTSLLRTQVLGGMVVFLNSIAITWMAYVGEGVASPYYAGLNLVVSGVLGFVPFTRRFAIAYIAVILVPYFALSWVAAGHAVPGVLIVNAFFLLANVAIAWILGAHQEQLRLRELRSRIGLKQEVLEREEIIEEKTQQGLRLASLSRQFSPQIIDAIREGRLSLDGSVHESRICAIFIDIVDSTERATTLSRESFERVINMFMEDTIPILLKHDITVDKFLGDGVLAFANDPVQHDDYVSRVALASLEIRERIDSRAEEYAAYWGEPLGVHMGIAQGPARVGFFGNKAFRSYTALGPVMSLANRLCGAALPGQILLCDSTRRNLRGSSLKIAKAGHSRLKGFGGQFFLYDLQRTGADSGSSSISSPLKIADAA